MQPLPSIPGSEEAQDLCRCHFELGLGIFAIFTCGLTAIPG